MLELSLRFKILFQTTIYPKIINTTRADIFLKNGSPKILIFKKIFSQLFSVTIPICLLLKIARKRLSEKCADRYSAF
ncbi:hypothetical protein DPV73_11555 [Leptospira mayottensis]|nr:hypothetical protein DPV73_11555 [Leptospira mayottensis]